MLSKVVFVVAIVVGSLTTLAIFAVLIVALVLPGWSNYQRFVSVQRLAPQLQLIPTTATLIHKKQVTQPGWASTAVYVEYDYRLARTISSAELESYYDSQLRPRGWTRDGDANVIEDTPSSANIYLDYTKPGQHHDWLDYSVQYFNGYYGGVREMDVKIKSLLNGTNN